MGGQGILEVVFGESNGYPGCQLSTPASSKPGWSKLGSLQLRIPRIQPLNWALEKNSRRIPWPTQNPYQHGDLTLNLIVS
jgi:hypothetical protein